LAFGHEIGRWNLRFERDMRRAMTDIMAYGNDMIWLNSISIGIPDVAPNRGGEVCSQYMKIRKVEGDNFPEGHCLWDEPGDPTRDTIRSINRYGYRVANTHTYGDLGTQMAIEVLEEASRERPVYRYSALDHSQLFNPTVIEKSGELKMIWSLSPSMFSGERSLSVEAAYGREVADRMLTPVRSLLDAGALVSYEGESENEYPLAAFEILVTRVTDRGYKLGAREAVDRKTALQILTINGAKYVLKEEKLGSIEVGKFGDLVVLERNPLDPRVADEELSDIKTLLTMVGGAIAYRDPGFTN
jgi:predicted amidohydrolase YtcJ